MIKRIWKRVKPWSIPICLTLLFFVLLRHVFLIGYVPSSSMEPTLKQDSLIFGFRVFEEPQVGDIIVFQKDGKLQVKRIAFGPGDEIDLTKLEYMDTIPIPYWNNPLLTVPADCYFVLGDNTQNSLDSRYWEDPFISDDQIVAIIP